MTLLKKNHKGAYFLSFLLRHIWNWDRQIFYAFEIGIDRFFFFTMWYHVCMESKNGYKRTHLQNRKGPTNIENKPMLTKGEESRVGIN